MGNENILHRATGAGSDNNWPTDGGGEVDLIALLRAIWSGRWRILLCAGAMLLLAVFYLHMATYKYTATMTVMPVQTNGASKLGGLGSLGGLASIAGVSLPRSSGDAAFLMYKRGPYTRDLAERLAKDSRIMHSVFAAEWDVDQQRWREPPSALRPYVRGIKNLLGVPVYPWKAPDAERLQVFLQQHFMVSEGDADPFLTLAFEYADPAFAPYLVSRVHTELDALLREKARARYQANIGYLAEQLGRVTLIEHRMAIASSLVEQENQLMTASSDQPYAGDSMGPASVQSRATSPAPVKILLLSLVFGLALGVFWVAGRHLVQVLGTGQSLRPAPETDPVSP